MTPSSFRLLGLLLLVFVAMTPFERVSGQGLEVDDRDIEDWARGRLAVSFDAISSELLRRPGILAPQLELAFGLALIATELDPKSSTAWRRLLEITTALEGDVPDAAEIRRRAIENLVKLEPGDDVMRLRLLLDRIDGRPTAQERVAAYQTLLEPENLERLGREAGARIAYDLALLQQRIGNLDAAAERIAQAVQLDPSFPQAADLAAGLFRSVVPTPIDEAELLTIAFTASPGDQVIARSLADLVLASGDYPHADDLFDLVSLLYPSTSPLQDVLIADRMLAMWGDGRSQDARDLADRSLRYRTLRIKSQLLRDGLDPQVVDELEVPPAPGISQVLAVIESREGDRTQRDAAVQTLFRSFQFSLDEIQRGVEAIEGSTEINEEQRTDALEAIATQEAGVFADQAWARAWFGWSPPPSGEDTDDDRKARLSLEDLLQGAIRGDAIDPEQEQVILGWAAMGKKDFEKARLLLAPVMESSPYAEAGIALLDEAEGATKEAARGYLKVYNARPGTLVGLWCRSRLEDILDTRIPMTEQGRLMGDMLSATMPEAVGRVVRDPRHGVMSISVEPKSLRNTAFEPTILQIKVTNVSSLKLAIGPDSPISPTLAIVPDVVDVVGMPSQAALERQKKPVIVSLDRNFSLDPQESIDISLDLTSTPLAPYFSMGSVFGGSYRMRGVVNYVVTPSGNIDAGQFGREGTSPVFRIDGLNLLGEDGSRLDRIVEDMRDANTVQDAKDIAAMLLLVVKPMNGDAYLSEESRLFATINACLALPPTARAWVMSLVAPGSGGTIRLVDRLVADVTRPSMALALSRFAGTPTANAIVAGLESDDPLIRRMAAAAKELAVMFEIQRDKSMLKFDDSEDQDG